MKSHTKLLLTLVASGLAILVFFGHVAWQTALNHEHKRRLVDLQTIVAGAYLDQPDNADLAEAFADHLRARHFYFIVDKDLHLLDTDATATLQAQVIDPVLARLSVDSDRHPHYRWAGDDFAWITQSLPDNRTLYFVSRTPVASAASYLRAMGPPMIAVTLVIIWALFWGGAYLVRLFGKLDSQRERLQYLALNDTLTTLPNRTLFQDRLEAAVTLGERSGTRFALCLVDLNRFKEINDLLGHDVGDEVLKETGRRLATVTRRSDTVARQGGDEFALLLPDTDLTGAELTLMRLMAIFDEPAQVAGQRLQLSGSIGLALYPDHGRDVESLTRAADQAMYESKRFNTPYAIYDPELHESENNLDMLRDLVEALDREAFELYYQPQLDLASGEPSGVEALLRWPDGNGGFTSPERFVPVAEQTGHIRRLTHWVCDRALSDYRAFMDRGHTPRLAINLSVCDLVDQEIADTLALLLDKHGVPADRVVLEVTESAMASSPQRVGRTLKKLVKALHVSVAVDDFGTGYSSLTHLQEMPVDEIKIDRSFVTQLKREGASYPIVKGIIGLAHDLGLRVVAEGIETQAVLDELQTLRCDIAQGFLIGRPMPRADMLDWLDRQAGTETTNLDDTGSDPRG